MRENIKIPKLRFPNFNEQWTEETIENLLLSSRLGGNYSNSETVNDNPLIKMGNLNRGNIKLDRLEYISENEIVNDKDLIKQGDLFFNTRNTLELVGKVAIWRNELSRAFYNSNLMYIKFSNNYFMNYRLNSFQAIKALKRLATGTTSVAAIYNKDLKLLKFNTPEQEEQQKIATFLTAVDEKINLLQKKKKGLEQYKKGVMQQLFSQKLRFKKEDGSDYPDWEEKMLGEIGKFQTSSVDKLLREGEKEVFLVNYMNVYRHENINSDTINKLNIVTAKDSQIVSNNLKKGDILFTPSSETPSDIGHSVVIFQDLKNTVYSYHLLRFRPTISIDIMYSHYFCNTTNVLKQMSRFATGSTRFTISVGNFSKVEFQMPCLEEQQKIANFLSQIDAKITIVNTQIHKMQQFKKGLLQQMFV